MGKRVLMPGDAYDRIKPTDLRKFERACRMLAEVVESVRTYESKARLYVNGGSVSLMIGPSHDDSMSHRPMQQNEAAAVVVPHIDGGDW